MYGQPTGFLHADCVPTKPIVLHRSNARHRECLAQKDQKTHKLRRGNQPHAYGYSLGSWLRPIQNASYSLFMLEIAVAIFAVKPPQNGQAMQGWQASFWLAKVSHGQTYVPYLAVASPMLRSIVQAQCRALVVAKTAHFSSIFNCQVSFWGYPSSIDQLPTFWVQIGITN